VTLDTPLFKKNLRDISGLSIETYTPNLKSSHLNFFYRITVNNFFYKIAVNEYNYFVMFDMNVVLSL